MKKGLLLTNIKLLYRVTGWYFSIRYRGVLMYVECAWFILYHVIFSFKEPSYFPKMSSAAFTLASDIGKSTMSLLET